MAVIAAVVLGIMMVLTVADVCGRYFFLKPITGTFELIGIMLVIAGCLGLGFCQLNQGNIRITIIADHLPPRGQAIVYSISYAIGAVVSGMICWRGLLRAWDYVFKTLGGVTVTLRMPFWPFMLLLALGFGWLCFILIIDTYLALKEVFRRGPN
jgi:TRAP-type C4-dicarboxylate transport system permease small subunit